MKAPSLTTLAVSWTVRGPKVLVSFHPHSDFAKRYVVLQAELDWCSLPTGMHAATAHTLRAVADILDPAGAAG